MVVDPDLPFITNNVIYPTAREMAASIMANAPKGAAGRVQQTIAKRKALKDYDLADYYLTVLRLLPPVN